MLHTRNISLAESFHSAEEALGETGGGAQLDPDLVEVHDDSPMSFSSSSGRRRGGFRAGLSSDSGGEREVQGQGAGEKAARRAGGAVGGWDAKQQQQQQQEGLCASERASEDDAYVTARLEHTPRGSSSGAASEPVDLRLASHYLSDFSVSAPSSAKPSGAGGLPAASTVGAAGQQVRSCAASPLVAQAPADCGSSPADSQQQEQQGQQPRGESCMSGGGSEGEVGPSDSGVGDHSSRMVSAFAALASCAAVLSSPEPGLSPEPTVSWVGSGESGAGLVNGSLGGGLRAEKSEGLVTGLQRMGTQGGIGSFTGGVLFNSSYGGGLRTRAMSSGSGFGGLAAHAPSRAGATKRSALFEELAVKRSRELGAEVTSTLSHMVQCDSRTVLAAYFGSGVPAPGEVYCLTVGELYRLEFLRVVPADVRASRLAGGGSSSGSNSKWQSPQRPGVEQQQQGGQQQGQQQQMQQWEPKDLLAFSEAECAEQLQLWTVAALCRCVGNAGLLNSGEHAK